MCMPLVHIWMFTSLITQMHTMPTTSYVLRVYWVHINTLRWLVRVNCSFVCSRWSSHTATTIIECGTKEIFFAWNLILYLAGFVVGMVFVWYVQWWSQEDESPHCVQCVTVWLPHCVQCDAVWSPHCVHCVTVWMIDHLISDHTDRLTLSKGRSILCTTLNWLQPDNLNLHKPLVCCHDQHTWQLLLAGHSRVFPTETLPSRLVHMWPSSVKMKWCLMFTSWTWNRNLEFLKNSWRLSMGFLTSCTLMDDLTHVYQDGLAFPSDGREGDSQHALWFLASAVLMVFGFSCADVCWTLQ